jgi:hypothetical protein
MNWRSLIVRWPAALSAMSHAAVQLEIFGLTEDQILAEAMQLSADALVMFDRLDNYRTNAKRTFQKEADRRSDGCSPRRIRPNRRAAIGSITGLRSGPKFGKLRFRI